MSDNPSPEFLWKKPTTSTTHKSEATALGNQFSPTQKEGQTEMCMPLT